MRRFRENIFFFPIRFDLQMHREHSATSMLLGKDYFSLTVFPNVDYVFISALVVILQEIHTDKND